MKNSTKFTCPVCGKSFKQKSDFYMHLPCAGKIVKKSLGKCR